MIMMKGSVTKPKHERNAADDKLVIGIHAKSLMSTLWLKNVKVPSTKSEIDVPAQLMAIKICDKSEIKSINELPPSFDTHLPAESINANCRHINAD